MLTRAVKARIRLNKEVRFDRLVYRQLKKQRAHDALRAERVRARMIAEMGQEAFNGYMSGVVRRQLERLHQNSRYGAHIATSELDERMEIRARLLQELPANVSEAYAKEFPNLEE